jgi:hypothetical protein
MNPFHRPLPSLLAAALGSAPLATAQEVLPFPAVPTAVDVAAEVLELEADSALLGALVDLDRVVLTGVPMPQGHLVELELERIDFDFASLGVVVDGVEASFDPLDLTLWKGGVAGVEGSDVFLALSSHGSYGWIDDGVGLANVSSFAGAGADWSRAGVRIFSERALSDAGDRQGPAPCEMVLQRGAGSGGNPIDPNSLGAPTYGPSPTLECKMAIETDFELYKIWSNLQAAETYVFALLAAASDRYDSQIGVVLTFPFVQFYTKNDDPWTFGGDGCGDALGRLQGAYAGKVPNGAHLVHLLSGANLGCGVAYLDVLCNKNSGFAVSGNINGGETFPINQGSNTWDFVVFTHETGHNFGTPHTHDYCPPLDKCYDNCTGGTQCTSQGTIMSYCHLCGGGMSNITTFFHPTVVNVMRTEAENSCLPDLDTDVQQVLFFEDFESGSLATNGWIAKKAKVKDRAAHEGNWGARVRRKGKLEIGLDTTGYQKIVLNLWRRTKNYDGTERLAIRYSTDGGSSWKNLEWVRTTGWGFVSFELPAAADDNAGLRLRFKSRGNEGKESGDLDEIELLGVIKP